MDGNSGQFTTGQDENIAFEGPGFVGLNSSRASRGHAKANTANTGTQNSAFQDYVDWFNAFGEDQKTLFGTFLGALQAAHGKALLPEETGLSTPYPVFHQRKFLFEKLEDAQQTQSGAVFKMAGSNGHLDIGAQGVRFVTHIQNAKNNDIGFTYTDAQMMALHAVQNGSWTEVKLTGTREQRRLLQLAIEDQNKFLPPEQRIKIQNPVRLAFSKPKDFKPFDEFIDAAKDTEPFDLFGSLMKKSGTGRAGPSHEFRPTNASPEGPPSEPATAEKPAPLILGKDEGTRRVDLSPEEQNEKDFLGMQTWLEYQKPADLKKPENLYAIMNGQDIFSYGIPGSDEYALYTFGENNKPYLVYLNVKGRAICLDGFDTELASAFHEDMKYHQKKTATFTALEEVLKAAPESATAKEHKLSGEYAIPFHSVYHQKMDVNGKPADVYYATQKNHKTGAVKFDVVKVAQESKTPMMHDELFMKNDETHPLHPENVYKSILDIARGNPDMALSKATPQELFNEFHTFYGQSNQWNKAREKQYSAVAERLRADLAKAPAPVTPAHVATPSMPQTTVNVGYTIGGAFEKQAGGYDIKPATATYGAGIPDKEQQQIAPEMNAAASGEPPAERMRRVLDNIRKNPPGGPTVPSA